MKIMMICIMINQQILAPSTIPRLARPAAGPGWVGRWAVRKAA